MTTNHHRKTSKMVALDRNRIARIIFSSAESMGLSDRKVIERLTDEIIKGGRLDLDGITHVVSTVTESMDATDRDLMAGLSEQIISRMGLTRPLPGMEEIIPAQEARPLSVAPQKRPSRKGIELSDNAIQVLERRYLRKDDSGRVIETADDMFHRVARNISSAEPMFNPNVDASYWEEEFYRLMASLEFLPNSPTLMNAGRELQQLSACFVLPIGDSMESIFDAVKYTALIHKSGGGTGFSFSRLRPQKDLVGSTGGVASGPVSFMRAFDTATDVIKQGGMRRGANMAILNIDHPDILSFIAAKENNDAFSNFNLSVAVTEEFMRAVEEGTDYNIINPRTGKSSGKRNAREVFDRIVDMAWRTGDPGIVFLDRVNKDNPTPNLGSIESTNPCGEQPLLPYESCNLGSINLSRMISQDGEGPHIDYPKLAQTAKAAVRFLDDVIEVNKFPLSEITEMTRKTRKIGLGIMGFADMLIRLGIPYDSDEALEVAEEVMSFIDDRATEASVELAGERGVFPAFEGSLYDAPSGPKVRNATRTTIAPTGTLSIIAGCSSGIEPLFALSYVRNILDNDRLIEINPYFEEVAKREGFYSEGLMKELARRGSIKDVGDIPERVKKLFVTAHDITPEWHVRMQAAFQKSTNNAVSKTVNFPHDATREDITKVFMLAYKEGLKGITIYRDRSKDRQVLSTGEEKGGEGVRLVPRRRGKVTTGITERVTTGCGNIYVTVNFDDDGICEVFSTLGKAGGCASAQLEATSRLISLALRSGVDLASIVKQLKGIRCPSMAWEEGHAVLSCADAIGSVLEKYLPGEGREEGGEIKKGETEEKTDASGLGANMAGLCPECSGILIYQEGCYICRNCGYTRC